MRTYQPSQEEDSLELLCW